MSDVRFRPWFRPGQILTRDEFISELNDTVRDDSDDTHGACFKGTDGNWYQVEVCVALKKLTPEQVAELELRDEDE